MPSINQPHSFSSKSSVTLSTVLDRRIQLQTALLQQHEVVFADHLLAAGSDTSWLLQAPSLVVMTPSITRLYGDAIERCFERSDFTSQNRFFVLQTHEAEKSADAALKVCQHALDMNLRRGGQIVAIGGGVCTDIAAFAAAIYRRGVACIKIPTTLIGLIDAGIGIKNGVNFRGKKSVLGTFSPPRYSVLDRSFLATVGEPQIRDGLSEALKMALISDASLVDLLQANGKTLRDSKLSCPAGKEVIEKSVRLMLGALCENIYEVNGYERCVDFGHTFSPFIEANSGYLITHGQAVAIDMAISMLLARDIGLVSPGEADSVISLIRDLGLPVHDDTIVAKRLHESLSGVVAHRNGKLNLVVPKGLGSYSFIRDVKHVAETSLGRVLNELRGYHDKSAGRC